MDFSTNRAALLSFSRLLSLSLFIYLFMFLKDVSYAHPRLHLFDPCYTLYVLAIIITINYA